MEYAEDAKEELIKIIKLASTGRADLTHREAVMLFHWINHINDDEYAWVPDEYKIDMPQYRRK